MKLEAPNQISPALASHGQQLKAANQSNEPSERVVWRLTAFARIGNGVADGAPMPAVALSLKN